MGRTTVGHLRSEVQHPLRESGREAEKRTEDEDQRLAIPRKALQYPQHDVLEPLLGFLRAERHHRSQTFGPALLKDIFERGKDVGEHASFLGEGEGETAAPLEEFRSRFGEDLAEEG